MLRLMLDAHPDLAVPGESHFIPALWRGRRRYARRDGGIDAERLARDIAATPHFGHWKIPAEPYLERVRALPDPSFADVVEAAFLANAAHHGKTRWADKTPIYVRQTGLLASLFPHARFVHLIRDGRDVAMSYLTLPWGPSTAWEAAYKWRRDVQAGLRATAALGPDRAMELRYENLVAAPRAELERLCAFAGLPFDPVMLRHAEDVDSSRLAPASGLAYHARSASPPRMGARDWRYEMVPPEVAKFEAIAGPLLERLGYERQRPSAPVTNRAQGVARGLAYRLQEAAGAARKGARSRLTGAPGAGIGSASAEAGPGAG
jgi:hypothetical protein